MDKILIALIISVVIIILVGFAIYLFLPKITPWVQNSTQGVQIGGPEAGDENSEGGGLTVCLDECGDSICQAVDPNCTNNLNCICPETTQTCPQDCK